MVGNSFTASASTIAFAGVSLLALAAPFELTQPLLRLPRQSISNLEAALLLAFASWGVALVWLRDMPRLRTPLTLPWIALVAVLIVAGAVSSVSRVNALHMAGRLTAAFGVFLLTVNGVTTRARLRMVAGLALAAGVVVSVLAFLEYARVPAVLDALKLFRPGLTTVGAQLRAGGPLQYPTITSMYLEVVFALGLGLLVSALDATPILFLALVVVAEAIILTFTRAGVITMVVSLAVVGLARRGRDGREQRLVPVAALGAVIAVLFFTSRSVESVWLRVTSEGQESWYRVRVAAPAGVDLATGRTASLPITITNTGRLVWDSHAETPFFLSYHWLPAEGDRFVSFEGERTVFPSPVVPGMTVTVPMLVRAPGQPGAYRLEWDVVQEGRLWFSTEPGAARFMSPARVSGAAFDDPRDRPMAPPRPTVRPGRLVLWRAAARMLAAHPLLGVGADNFRLTYGDYAGLKGADPRLHSNNMYVEMLAGGGLVGGGAFFWLFWRAGALVAKTVRIEPGLGAAGLAIAIHGLVDSFLSFAPTYILFSLVLGLAVACTRVAEMEPDAHRI